MVIFLICQPDVNSDIYADCFEALYRHVQTTGKSEYLVLLGDLLDQDIYGAVGYYCFERRLKMYIESRSADRLVSILMLIHQRV